jgi:hypothetical protein
MTQPKNTKTSAKPLASWWVERTFAALITVIILFGFGSAALAETEWVHRWKIDGYYGDNEIFHAEFDGACNELFELACWWDSITCSGTAENGCKIEVYSVGGNYEYAAAHDAKIRARDQADPLRPSASNYPSARPHASASVAWMPAYLGNKELSLRAWGEDRGKIVKNKDLTPMS